VVVVAAAFVVVVDALVVVVVFVVVAVVFVVVVLVVADVRTGHPLEKSSRLRPSYRV
jgi:hypothetical protein